MTKKQELDLATLRKNVTVTVPAADVCLCDLPLGVGAVWEGKGVTAEGTEVCMVYHIPADVVESGYDWANFCNWDDYLVDIYIL